MREYFKPRYESDADYTTNAPSYYDELARKNELLKTLAKRIWEYDKTLTEGLENVNKTMNDYILKWEERIENIDDEVTQMLIDWLNDGTIDHIINEEIFSDKADKSDLEHVNYAMFDDGILTDDEIILKAHQFANLIHKPVVNMTGEYYLTSPLDIPIETDVFWGNTIFHIDESAYALDKPYFNVKNTKESVILPIETHANIINHLNGDTGYISELVNYPNSLMIITDENTRIGQRSTFNQDWAQEDFYIIGEKGQFSGDKMFTFSAATSIEIIPIPDNYLTIDGGSFLLNGQNISSSGNYFKSGFEINRSKTIIKNQTVKNEEGMLDNVSPSILGFYYPQKVYDITLQHLYIKPRKTGGSYGIGGRRVMKFTIENVNGYSNETDWGVMGTNLIKDLYIDKCVLNRVDVHFQAWNVTIKNSDITGDQGILLNGGGLLYIDNVTVKHARNIFIEFRNDYGATWNGDIVINNSTIKVKSSEPARVIYMLPTQFNYKYPIVFGKTIKVTNFTMDYSEFKTNTEKSWLMIFANFSSGTNIGRIQFPSKIIFENIRVKGREKGTALFTLDNPREYLLDKKGSFIDGQIIPNCHMIFKNIDGEKNENVNFNSSSSSSLAIEGSFESTYLDEYALYPKIEIENYGQGLVAMMRGSIADVYVTNTEVNAIESYTSTGNRSKFTFLNCDFKSNVNMDLQTLRFKNNIQPTFINSKFYPITIKGVTYTNNTSMLDRYAVFYVNSHVFYNHVNTKISNSIQTAIPLTTPFVNALANHHENQVSDAV